MDGDDEQSRSLLIQREKRWSMNSQRLEEIVALLMKPIAHRVQIFDTDLASLLEEYLTEAGLRALEHEVTEASDDVKPNFAEVALLLQQSANIYGRKVDFLYERVVSVSDLLLNQETERTNQNTNSEEQATPRSRQRRRRLQSSQADAFASIELESGSSTLRALPLHRAPPTLPPVFIDLEPRLMTDFDAPLYDYEDEPIGLIADFNVTLRLQEGGMLVDELTSMSTSESSRLRPIPLMELQAAIEAAAPRDLSPPPAEASAEAGVEAMPPPAIRRPLALKRKQLDNAVDISGLVAKLHITDAMLERLQVMTEFSINAKWIKEVVGKRKNMILSERRQLRNQDLINKTSIGFDAVTGEFLGWSVEEARAALHSGELTLLRRSIDSDDGFYAALDEPFDEPHAVVACTSVEWSEWSDWQTRIMRRAVASEARGVDVRALARRVLAALPAPPRERDFTHVLRETAREQHEVSTLFLSTLFLANAGNVEIIQNTPLSSSFSLKLLSTDERLYSTAAAADEHLLKGQNASRSSVDDSISSANDSQFMHQPTDYTNDDRERPRHHKRHKHSHRNNSERINCKDKQSNGEHSPTPKESKKRRNGELAQHSSRDCDSSQSESKRHRDSTSTMKSKIYESQTRSNVSTHSKSKSSKKPSQIELNNSVDPNINYGIIRRCYVQLTDLSITSQVSDLPQNMNSINIENFVSNNDPTTNVDDSRFPTTNVNDSRLLTTNVNDSRFPTTNVNDSGFSSSFTFSINSEPSTDCLSPDYTSPAPSTSFASPGKSPVSFVGLAEFTSPNR